MAVGYGTKLKKYLTDNGCNWVRSAKGSHEFWYSPITKLHFSVPVDCKMKHTANAICKQAGLPKKF